MSVNKKAIKAVFLEWDDAHSFRAQWTLAEDLEDHTKPYPCYSVGFVIKETKTHITIAGHTSFYVDGDLKSGTGDMTIPKKMITRRQDNIKIPKI